MQAFKHVLNSLEAEFLDRSIRASFASNHSSGNQEQGRTVFHDDNAGFGRSMRKQAKREACRTEFGYAPAIPKESRSVSRVEEAKGSELLVVTREERRTRDHARRDRDQSAIKPNRQFRQRVGLVDVFGGQEFGS